MTRLIIAVAGFIIAGGIFFFYTKSTYDDVQKVQVQIDQYDAALEKATELQKLKQTLLSRFNAFHQEDKDRLQKLLPDHVDNVRLILDLDNLAGRYGLSLQNVDVSSSEAQGAKNQTAIGAIGASSQKYDSLSLTFGTRGTYKDFIQFLGDLESSLRIVDLVSLTITTSPAGSALEVPTGARPRAPGEPVYTYNLILRTYWLK